LAESPTKLLAVDKLVERIVGVVCIDGEIVINRPPEVVFDFVAMSAMNAQGP
jgi:hypothetical protein